MNLNLIHVLYSRRCNAWCASYDYPLGGEEHCLLWRLYDAWERAYVRQTK